ncbi:MAG TPA: stage IV sporulation protein A [Clostridiales bacterium]|nr:stage IV sporulation protein A [Clostridiales bacterium]
MEKYGIYQQIAERTQGDIYIGVVGPVRTGKSTFIKRFMDLLVIPNIDNEFKRERARDELPQSSAGKTIMTTEPKFVPNEAVEISLEQNVRFRVRMVDCVGYIVKAALGYFENDMPRMVDTPWFDHKIPFEEAAETGTRKVIREHSTIGLVVVTDGSITDLAREEYLEAEHRVIQEMKASGKPFLILLNTVHPNDPATVQLAAALQEEHQVPVISVNCMVMRMEDINRLLENMLYEFPIAEIGFTLPRWVDSLDESHWLRVELMNAIRENFGGITRIREVRDCVRKMEDVETVLSSDLSDLNLGNGNALVDISLAEKLFYRILSETSGLEVDGEHRLVQLLKDLARIKKEYEKIEFALHEVRNKGYGIVSPQMDELALEEPEIVKQGARFGVRLKASAPSIHMIRADIETVISPLVGSEKQSEELLEYLLKEFEGEPGKIWDSNIFGKSLHELISEGLQNKLFKMPEEAQMKLKETLQRIVNEGSGGLICIIL